MGDGWGNWKGVEADLKWKEFSLFGGKDPITVIEGVEDVTDFFLVPPWMSGKRIRQVMASIWSYQAAGVYELWRGRCGVVLGDETTTWTVTKTDDTCTYTRTGGTDPGISNSKTSLQVGDAVSITGDFAAGNQLAAAPLTAVGTNSFSVSNAGGSAETGKKGALTVDWAARKVATGDIGYLTRDDDVADLLCDPGSYVYDYLYPLVSTAPSTTSYGLKLLVGIG